MSIRYRTDAKAQIAEIWVTGDTPEAKITECRTTLQAVGYYCVTYRSGRENITANTKALLEHNLYPG